MVFRRWESTVQHRRAAHIRSTHRHFTRRGAQGWVDGMTYRLAAMAPGGLDEVLRTYRFAIRDIRQSGARVVLTPPTFKDEDSEREFWRVFWTHADDPRKQ